MECFYHMTNPRLKTYAKRKIAKKRETLRGWLPDFNLLSEQEKSPKFLAISHAGLKDMARIRCVLWQCAFNTFIKPNKLLLETPFWAFKWASFHNHIEPSYRVGVCHRWCQNQQLRKKSDFIANGPIKEKNEKKRGIKNFKKKNNKEIKKLLIRNNFMYIWEFYKGYLSL